MLSFPRAIGQTGGRASLGILSAELHSPLEAEAWFLEGAAPLLEDAQTLANADAATEKEGEGHS